MKNINCTARANKCIRFFIIFLFSTIAITHTHAAGLEDIFRIGNSFFPKAPTPATTTLSEQELANLIRPSIVRIVTRSVGTTTFTVDFDVDLLTLSFTPRPKPKILDDPFDFKLTGTGFIITPDGYVVTNSHVVSTKKAILKDEVATLRSAIVLAFLQTASMKDLKKFNDLASTTEGTKRMKDFGDQLEKKLTESAQVTVTETAVVLDPLSKKDTFDDLFKEGFPAKIVYANELYKDDERDVAVIKIEKENLPAIPLTLKTGEAALNTGERIYTFGFPSNADIAKKTAKNILEPTFTSGLVNSFKDSIKNDFKLIQTDAKISSGSSGSPAVNSAGDVVGLISFGTSQATQSSGDSFAFAIPIQPIMDTLSKANVTPEAGALVSHFAKGNQLLTEKHCTQAIAEFTKAKTVNESFYQTDFIEPYIEKCKTMRANKLSIDTEEDLFKINIAPWKNTIYGSLGALFAIIIVGIFTVRRLRHDEEKMEQLEKMATSSAQAPQPVAPVTTPPVAPTQAPTTTSPSPEGETLSPRMEEVLTFIKTQTAAQTVSGTIVLQLRAAGYTDEEIVKGFDIFNKKTT